MHLVRNLLCSACALPFPYYYYFDSLSNLGLPVSFHHATEHSLPHHPHTPNDVNKKKTPPSLSMMIVIIGEHG